MTGQLIVVRNWCCSERRGQTRQMEDFCGQGQATSQPGATKTESFVARIERGYYYFSELSISSQLIRPRSLAGARRIRLNSRIFTSQVIARADSIRVTESQGSSGSICSRLSAVRGDQVDKSSIAGPAAVSILRRTAVYLRSGEGTDDS